MKEAQNSRDYTVRKMSDEIHEIIRVLQLTTYDEDEWDEDDLAVMKKAQVTSVLKRNHACVLERNHDCMLERKHACVLERNHVCVLERNRVCVLERNHACAFQDRMSATAENALSESQSKAELIRIII